jgi:hypothetical protein
LPFADAGKRAEQKLLAAMTDGEATKARELAARLRLETAAATGTRPVLAAVEDAVTHRRVVTLDYRDRDGGTTTRVVEAHGLHFASDAAYLVGWCRLRDASRSFRLDRISKVKPTGEIAPERPLDTFVDWADTFVPETAREENGMPPKAAPRRSNRGAPRRAEHRTGSSRAFATAIATALPGTTATNRRGTTSFRVEGSTYLTVDDESAVVRDATDDEHSFLFVAVGRDDLRAAIEDAWASIAPKPAVTSYRRARQRYLRQPALTEDDIRRLVLALPGANEGPIWGQELGFRVGEEKRTRFARFGPPEAGRVGNLLPPDDEHTLVILECEQKPELLASSADRYFATPHYGPVDEPGGIILRLAEHRGPAALAEVGELLEDAWRAVAPPELVEQYDRGRARR